MSLECLDGTRVARDANMGRMSSDNDFLVSGEEHIVDAAALTRELHDAWLDLDSVELHEGHLILNGDRYFAVRPSGKVRHGRFGWTLDIEGAESFWVEDPHELSRIMVCSVEEEQGRIKFIGCTPGQLVVEGFGTLRFYPSPYPLPKRRRPGGTYTPNRFRPARWWPRLSS